MTGKPLNESGQPRFGIRTTPNTPAYERRRGRMPVLMVDGDADGRGLAWSIPGEPGSWNDRKPVDEKTREPFVREHVSSEEMLRPCEA